MIEGEDEVLFWGTIEAYKYPLIRLADIPAVEVQSTEDEEGRMTVEFVRTDGRAIPSQIINVTSPNFISATKQP